MTALFQAVLFLVHFVRSRFGDSGMVITGALLGLTDIDALTLSMSRQAAGGTDLESGGARAHHRDFSNTIVKLLIGVAFGRGAFRTFVGIGPGSNRLSLSPPTVLVLLTMTPSLRHRLVVQPRRAQRVADVGRDQFRRLDDTVDARRRFRCPGRRACRSNPRSPDCPPRPARRDTRPARRRSCRRSQCRTRARHTRSQARCRAYRENAARSVASGTRAQTASDDLGDLPGVRDADRVADRHFVASDLDQSCRRPPRLVPTATAPLYGHPNAVER